MTSDDYKNRFKAEMDRLQIRIRGLKKMIDNWDACKLVFTPTCPRSIYTLQLRAMEDYMAILEARAMIEKII